MATTGIAPIKQALVRALRDNLALKTMVGADGIDEGVAKRKTNFPYIVYRFVYTRRDYDHTNVGLVSDVDVWSISDDVDEAQTLDQLVAEALGEDVDLNQFFEGSSGQISLNCQRIGDLSDPDDDGTGKVVHAMGGAYRVWTDQSRTA